MRDFDSGVLTILRVRLGYRSVVYLLKENLTKIVKHHIVHQASRFAEHRDGNCDTYSSILHNAFVLFPHA